MKLPKVLKQPSLPENLPMNAKWLAGEGAGSWFVMEEKTDYYIITRYSPKGIFECENNFEKLSGFDFSNEYGMGYPSHCALVTILQNGRKFRLSLTN